MSSLRAAMPPPGESETPHYTRVDFRIGVEVLEIINSDGSTWQAWWWGANVGNADLPLVSDHEERQRRARLFWAGPAPRSIASFDLEQVQRVVSTKASAKEAIRDWVGLSDEERAEFLNWLTGRTGGDTKPELIEWAAAALAAIPAIAGVKGGAA